MGRDPSSTDADIPPDVLAIAARIFAGLGYDGTSTELIVQAGVDAEIVGRAGGRAGLYRAVIEHAHRQVIAALEPAISQLTPDAVGIQRLADAFLDFSIENPYVSALWMHRSLADAADLSDMESRYLAEVYSRVTDALRGTVSTDMDAQMTVLTFEWCIYGFIRGGILDERGLRVDPKNRAVLERFRRHLHWLIEVILSAAQPGVPASGPVTDPE